MGYLVTNTVFYSKFKSLGRQSLDTNDKFWSLDPNFCVNQQYGAILDFKPGLYTLKSH